MPRIVLGLEYDGSPFAGWQEQAHAQGIRPIIEAVVSSVANEPVSVMAAGRTDAGVHATLQVAHFDTSATRSERGWVMGANSNLPEQISVLWAREVNETFHSRHSAMARSYRYVILNRAPRPALLRNRVCWVREPLDEQRMHTAAQALLGENDFTSFRAAACQSPTPMRNLHSIRVTRHQEYVVIDVTANAFLHHMVRNIAGVLIAVGRHKQALDWPAQVLQARDRKVGGMTAAAAGLYLFRVNYPAQFALPTTPHCSAWPPGPVL